MNVSRVLDTSRLVGRVTWDFLDHPVPIPIAHRGGSLEAPENTMRAFAHAISLGYRCVELDVRATVDLEVVVFHDATLERMTGARGAIERLRWRDLREHRVAGTEAISRLTEVLDTWPELRVSVEMKDDAVVAPLAHLLGERDAWGRVCLASFSDARLRRIRMLSDGRARTSMGEWGAARLRVSGYGVPVGHAGDLVQVPVRWRGMTVVDERLVADCHRRGLQVQVWTVNERDEMERLLDLGVDGLMTDRPTVLKELLVERGVWRAAVARS
jgi:glycerophosphoryl diester phosphodiesterase